MSEILNNNGTVTLSLEEYNELRDELASAKEKLESLEGKLRDYENDPTSKFVIITKETYYDPYMDDDVTEISRLMQIGRRTRSIVRQNVIFAIGVKISVLVLAAIGIATMWMAVFADVGVTVLAVFNAMRALKIKE